MKFGRSSWRWNLRGVGCRKVTSVDAEGIGGGVEKFKASGNKKGFICKVGGLHEQGQKVGKQGNV
ncbi:hypothetical protein H5410_026619 [Solanum commersonii]|uniref:Uncharacterized protein n=1 Tax=Solanum commersonii TaxID=4109 RepID=A0A9J5YZJ6_SOLCO|nr:hypothetical protein H5410_026619 [Solanum commersonii]